MIVGSLAKNQLRIYKKNDIFNKSSYWFVEPCSIEGCKKFLPLQLDPGWVEVGMKHMRLLQQVSEILVGGNSQKWSLRVLLVQLSQRLECCNFDPVYHHMQRKPSIHLFLHRVDWREFVLRRLKKVLLH